MLSENHHPIPFQVQVYLGSFDPNDVQKNYLSDEGRADGLVYGQHFTVPALKDFVVVVSGIASDKADPEGSSYRMAVGGCGEATDAGAAETDSGASSNDGGSGGKTW